MTEITICVCAILLTGSLGCFLICCGTARLRESKFILNDEESDDGGEPPTPFDIDPQKDPSDWWKHPIRSDN